MKKKVDLEDPTPLLDQVYLGALSDKQKSTREFSKKARNSFSKLTSTDTAIKIENKRQRKRCRMDMEGHSRKCVERYCLSFQKATDQLHTVSTPCLDDHRHKLEDIEWVDMLSNCIEQLFFCSYWSPWSIVDSEQICHINHKMEQSLQQKVAL